MAKTHKILIGLFIILLVICATELGFYLGVKYSRPISSDTSRRPISTKSSIPVTIVGNYLPQTKAVTPEQFLTELVNPDEVNLPNIHPQAISEQAIEGMKKTPRWYINRTFLTGYTRLRISSFDWKNNRVIYTHPYNENLTKEVHYDDSVFKKAVFTATVLPENQTFPMNKEDIKEGDVVEITRIIDMTNNSSVSLIFNVIKSEK